MSSTRPVRRFFLFLLWPHKQVGPMCACRNGMVPEATVCIQLFLALRGCSCQPEYLLCRRLDSHGCVRHKDNVDCETKEKVPWPAFAKDKIVSRHFDRVVAQGYRVQWTSNGRPMDAQWTPQWTPNGRPYFTGTSCYYHHQEYYIVKSSLKTNAKKCQ